jgi:hypothetical protein
MTAETATVRRAGKAVEMTTWAELSAQYADPYAELARQLVEGAIRKFDAALIGAANATGSGQTTVDRSTGTITYDAIVDALNAFRRRPGGCGRRGGPLQGGGRPPQSEGR